MRRELIGLASAVALCSLPFSAFSQRQKRAIRKRQGGKCAMTGDPIQEVHHKIPLHKGGKDITKNGVGLSRVAHAFVHRRRSLDGRGGAKATDRWATKSIIKRMNRTELRKFNKAVKGGVLRKKK